MQPSNINVCSARTHTHTEGLRSSVFLQLFLQNSVSILSVGVGREIFEYIKKYSNNTKYGSAISVSVISCFRGHYNERLGAILPDHYYVEPEIQFAKTRLPLD